MASDPTLPSADERLSLILVKIERAKKHILDLKGEIDAFLSTRPYGVVEKIDPKLGELSYGISRVTPIPGIIAAITGDAIQNLRSALDHLAYQLLLVRLGAAASKREPRFPVARTRTDYKSLIDGKIQLLFRQDAIDALRKCEAYKGGKGNEIWVLHRLNNIDKHRSIIAVGSAYDPSSTVSDFPHMVFFRPAANMSPLQIGDALLVRSEMHLKQDFRFEIALNEPKIIERKPLIETVQHLADLVSSTVLCFRPCLS